MDILVPILSLGGLGLAFGIGLALAAKKFCVAQDGRLEKIYNKLPGANCGACGMPGCMGFAEGLIQGNCSIDKCAVVGEKEREHIASILGIEHIDKVKSIARLHCNGGLNRAKDKFTYIGIRDCDAANMLSGGPKACIYGCIGFATCVRACPFGAISMDKEGLPVIDETKCVACGKCIEACPKKLFTLVPHEKNYVVRCKSKDLGKVVIQACSVGCIACRKCEKICPVLAIKVIDNLAIIDYNICTDCGKCFEVCPTKTICKIR